MVLAYLLGVGLPGGVMGDMSQYTWVPPPDINLIGPPPKPPWLTTFDLQCNGSDISVIGEAPPWFFTTAPPVTRRRTTEGPQTSPSSPSVSASISGGEVAAFVVPLLLIVLLLVLLLVWYKKRYSIAARHGGKWFKVKPEPLDHDQTNYLYNYRVMGKKWRDAARKRAFDDKRALISTDTPTSQLSLSSGSGDTGYGGDVTETTSAGDKSVKDETNGASRGTSGLGTSDGDLLDDAYVETETHMNGDIYDAFPRTDTTQTSDVLTQGSMLRTSLPILAPIKSSHDPTLSVSSPLEAANVDHYPYRSPRMLEPISCGLSLHEKQESAERKRRKKKRKHLSKSCTGDKCSDNMAMEPMVGIATHTTVIKLPATENKGNGESNA